VSNKTEITGALPKPNQVKAALRLALSNTSKDFIKDVLNKMAKSKPSGRVYYSRRKGFHRASAPGQRPAIDTTTLFKSFDYNLDKQDLVSVVYIRPRVNPENGARADQYAEILQVARNRKIMTAQDAKSFEKVLRRKVEKVRRMFSR
jgi:hypothetical protein